MTDLGKADSLVDALFGMELEEEFKCEETGESKISTATAKKLVCNIQGGAGSNTQAKTGDPLRCLLTAAAADAVAGVSMMPSV